MCPRWTNVFARRFIDVPPCGLLVPMSLAAAVAALPLVAQQLALLDGAPLAATFRLPLEKEELRNFLHPPNSQASADLPRSPVQPVPPANVQSGFAAQLRGLDLNAHWRESPVWRFGGSGGEVIGSDVRVNLRAVSERLRMPALVEPANEAPAAAALAQAFFGLSSTHGTSVRGSSSLKAQRSCWRRPIPGACWHLCQAPRWTSGPGGPAFSGRQR